jgi:Fe2+ transport system protein FeoA
MAMGILPGVSIEILQKFPSYVLKISHSQVAMDREMAEGIQIRLPQMNRQ